MNASAACRLACPLQVDQLCSLLLAQPAGAARQALYDRLWRVSDYLQASLPLLLLLAAGQQASADVQTFRAAVQEAAPDYLQVCAGGAARLHRGSKLAGARQLRRCPWGQGPAGPSPVPAAQPPQPAAAQRHPHAWLALQAWQRELLARSLLRSGYGHLLEGACLVQPLEEVPVLAAAAASSSAGDGDALCLPAPLPEQQLPCSLPLFASVTGAVRGPRSFIERPLPGHGIDVGTTLCSLPPGHWLKLPALKRRIQQLSRHLVLDLLDASPEGSLVLAGGGGTPSEQLVAVCPGPGPGPGPSSPRPRTGARVRVAAHVRATSL